MPGLLAEKLGMTQIFTTSGAWVPVTVLKAGPCVVVMKKSPEREGYSAVQLGFAEPGQKKKNRKPYSGHFTKKGLKVSQHLKEIRTKRVDQYAPGDVISVAHFQMGDFIDVQGVSKGKGFQGVIKRHHFAGGMATHGCSLSHRVPGSIGQRTYPGKVFKGKRMAGRMGGDMVTTKNLEVVGVEAEQNILLVKGSVPGGNHCVVTVYPKTHDFEDRFLASKKAS